MHARSVVFHFACEDENFGRDDLFEGAFPHIDAKLDRRAAAKLRSGTKRNGTPQETTSIGRFVSAMSRGSTDSISATAPTSSTRAPNVGSGCRI
jgi:hypothetical protein